MKKKGAITTASNSIKTYLSRGLPRKHTIKVGIRDGCKGLTVPDILFTGVVSRWISQLIPDVQLVNRSSHLTADVRLQVATNYILVNSYLLDVERCQTRGLLNKNGQAHCKWAF